MTSEERPLPAVPARDPRGHKGTFGTVAVIGGRMHDGVVMVGGPCLSAVAALRSGCGLARLAMPEPLLHAGLAVVPSATGVALPVDHEHMINGHAASGVIDDLILEADAIAIGPGLGLGQGPSVATLRCLAQRRTPVVIDADALNVIASIPNAINQIQAPAILTPHPGEYSRLAEAGEIDADAKDAKTRTIAAERLALKVGAIVVLKGANTVVSDGRESWVCRIENAALATAGVGDVLTGVAASFVAQFYGKGEAPLTLFDCARLAVQAHALAGEQWHVRRGASGGLLAMELTAELPAAIETLRDRAERA